MNVQNSNKYGLEYEVTIRQYTWIKLGSTVQIKKETYMLQICGANGNVIPLTINNHFEQ